MQIFWVGWFAFIKIKTKTKHYIIFQKAGLSVLQPKTGNINNANDKKRGQKRAFSKVDQVKSPHV